MTLIVGILFTIIFYSLTAQSIKKHPGAYYVGMYAWTGLVVCYYNMDYYRWVCEKFCVSAPPDRLWADIFFDF